MYFHRHRILLIGYWLFKIQSRLSQSLIKKLSLSLGVVLVLSLTSCCKNCLLSRAEISWSKTTETNKIHITEIHDGDKYVEIASGNGGVLKKFTLDSVSTLIPQSNDTILKDAGTGKSVSVIKQESYKSNDKNAVFIDSILDNGLKFHKSYRMNLESGDLFISRKIENGIAGSKTISLIQTLSVKSGGYLIIPLSIISRYPSRFITYDDSGKIEYNPVIKGSKIVNEKLISPTKGENITLRSDASDGWFGYVLDDKMLLVKYSLQNCKRTDNPLIFTAKITEDKIDFSFGETNKPITIDNQLESSERLVLVNLDEKAQSVQDVETAMKYIKIPLILVR